MKTYKFKLYSNHGNHELHKTIDGCRHISKLKRLARFTHWNQLPSQSIRDVVARIDKGYKAMFEARAKGQAWDRPRFKPRHKYKSFTLLQAGWKLLPGNKIRIRRSCKTTFSDKSESLMSRDRRLTSLIAQFHT